jgi:AcrR family transcriptional regulator
MSKLERRQDLLRAARSVFAEKGYHEAKIDDIVAIAGVATGTFYLYFRDKRALFAELVQGLFIRLGEAILRVDPAADVEAQIKHNIRAIVAVLLDDPTLTSILLSYAAGLDPAFITQIRAFNQGVKRLLVESLQDGQRLGIVAPGDPKLYATFTIGALKEVLFENALGEQARPREEIVTALFDLLGRGYLRIDGVERVERAPAEAAVAPPPAPAKRRAATKIKASAKARARPAAPAKRGR